MTQASSHPVIETDRLILRVHTPGDMAARLAMTNDPEVLRHVGGVPQDREENWARILRYNGHWALLGYGLFAIVEKGSGAWIGEAGLANFHRGLGEDFDPFPEGAWMFSAATHGKGYATEAVRAILGWHEGAFGPARKVCVIAPENGPSLRVAEKLGFAAFAERIYKGASKLLLERPA